MVMGRRAFLLLPWRGCWDRSLKAVKLRLEEQDEGLFLNVVGVIRNLRDGEGLWARHGFKFRCQHLLAVLILGKSLYLSEPQFLICQMGIMRPA